MRLALSKGRILEETLPLLARVGVQLEEDSLTSRKLILATSRPDLDVIIIRATDVPTFVTHGAADLGVAGLDVLQDQGCESIYEPVDLGIACCKLMVAKPVGAKPVVGRPLKVATKFTQIAQDYFARQGQQVELIKLYGSMELAPLVGLADCIVDVVDTGRTLAENGLEPTELIMPVSSRLIVNKAAYKLKFHPIKALIEQMRSLCSGAVASVHEDKLGVS